jgi:hypothetical protein
MAILPVPPEGDVNDPAKQAPTKASDYQSIISPEVEEKLGGFVNGVTNPIAPLLRSVTTAGDSKSIISPEVEKKLDVFVNDATNPIGTFVRSVKYAGSSVIGVGSSFYHWLNGKK